MARSKISDSPSLSSAPATDEKEKARQIITQIDSKSVKPNLLVCFASFPGQNSLGLVDIFPYSENIQPLYQHKNTKWGPFNFEIKFEPWPFPKFDWWSWVGRMYNGLKDKWEYLGIANAVLTSKTPIKPDTHLITALISF